MPQKFYHGFRQPDHPRYPVRVEIIMPDGTKQALPGMHKLINHSPCGFEWGYEGSGPAQLALALVADACQDRELAMRVHQDFKRLLVAGFGETWMLSQEQIADLAYDLDRPQQWQADPVYAARFKAYAEANLTGKFAAAEANEHWNPGGKP